MPLRSRSARRISCSGILTVSAAAAVVFFVITPSWSPFAMEQSVSRYADADLHLGPASPFDTNGPVRGDTYLGPLTPEQPIVLVVSLKYRNEAQMMNLLGSFENPRSADFRHYLTSAEFDNEFGPSAAAVNEVQSYFVNKGASSITPSSDGLLLTVVMNVSSIRETFGVGLGWFRGSGMPYYNAVASPTLSPQIESLISGVSGLTDEDNEALSLSPGSISQGSSLASMESPAEFDKVSNSSQLIYWGTDYRAVYGEMPLLENGTNGTGYAVDTILTSGWNKTANGGKGQDIPPFDPEALSAYYEASFPHGVPLPDPVGVPVTVQVGGTNVTPPLPGPPPVLSGEFMTDNSGSVLENCLDLEMVGSMAPGAAIYNFYFSGSLVAQSLDSAASNFDLALDKALAYDYGSNKLAVITNSWGLADEVDTVWNGLEQKAAAMGVTILASSGDQGDAPTSLQNHPQGQWPGFPATATFDSYGAIAVGGTEVNVSGTPTGTWNPTSGAAPPAGYDAPNISGIASGTAWFTPSSDPSQYSGTEGGISEYEDEPIWQARSVAQSGIEYAATQEEVNYARGVPDVAASAYDTIVYQSEAAGAKNDVAAGIVGGTSVSSPLFAGMVALLAQSGGTQLGFLDPEIYNISSYFSVHPGPLNPFTDVPTGHNYAFNASKGWDALTGWGSPNATLLAEDLANKNCTTFVYNPSGVPGEASGPPSTGQTVNTLQNTYYLLAIATVFIVASITIFAAQKISSNRSVPRLKPPSGSSSTSDATPPEGQVEILACKACGREYDKAWGFCPHCGAYPDSR